MSPDQQDSQQEMVASMLNLVALLSEAAGGMRKSLIAQGFEETPAEVMAFNFYSMMLHRIAHEGHGEVTSGDDS